MALGHCTELPNAVEKVLLVEREQYKPLIYLQFRHDFANGKKFMKFIAQSSYSPEQSLEDTLSTDLCDSSFNMILRMINGPLPSPGIETLFLIHIYILNSPFLFHYVSILQFNIKRTIFYCYFQVWGNISFWSANIDKYIFLNVLSIDLIVKLEMFSRYLSTDIFKSLENEFYRYRKCMYIYVKKYMYMLLTTTATRT